MKVELSLEEKKYGEVSKVKVRIDGKAWMAETIHEEIKRIVKREGWTIE